MAIFTGHHTLQKGWLGIVDPARGRQENQGAQLIAPVRETEAERIDSYGQSGDQFQYPYPLSETEFLVAFKPDGATTPFAIYWMDKDGRRELLASDPQISCNQPVPLAARPVPHVRPKRRRLSQEARPLLHAGHLRGAGPGRRAARHGEKAARRRARLSRGRHRQQRKQRPGRRRHGQHADFDRATARGIRKSCSARRRSTTTARPSSRFPPERPSTSRRSTRRAMRSRRCEVGRRFSRARSRRAWAATNRRTRRRPSGLPSRWR